MPARGGRRDNAPGAAAYSFCSSGPEEWCSEIDVARPDGREIDSRAVSTIEVASAQGRIANGDSGDALSIMLSGFAALLPGQIGNNKTQLTKATRADTCTHPPTYTSP